MHRLVTALAAIAFATTTTAEPIYGCDDERWAQWKAILAQVQDWPEEYADARIVYETNRRVCEAMERGRISEEEALHRYEAERDAWLQRIQRRQQERHDQRGLGGVG